MLARHRTKANRSPMAPPATWATRRAHGRGVSSRWQRGSGFQNGRSTGRTGGSGAGCANAGTYPAAVKETASKASRATTCIIMHPMTPRNAPCTTLTLRHRALLKWPDWHGSVTLKLSSYRNRPQGRHRRHNLVMYRLTAIATLILLPNLGWADDWVIIGHVRTADCLDGDETCQTNLEFLPPPDQPIETRSDCLNALDRLTEAVRENGLLIDAYCEQR